MNTTLINTSNSLHVSTNHNPGWKKVAQFILFEAKDRLKRLTVSKRSFSALSRLMFLLYHLKAGKVLEKWDLKILLFTYER